MGGSFVHPCCIKLLLPLLLFSCLSNKENLPPVHHVYMNPLTGPLRMRSRVCRTSGIAEFLRATTTAACPGHMYKQSPLLCPLSAGGAASWPGQCEENYWLVLGVARSFPCVVRERESSNPTFSSSLCASQDLISNGVLQALVSATGI